MLIPTNKHLYSLSQKDLEYAEEFNNSIKIDFSKIKQFNQIQNPNKIKICSNQKCGVILSAYDRPTLLNSKDYLDNYDAFTEKEKIKQSDLQQNNKQQMVWICRYCGMHQIIYLDNAQLIDKPTKFLLNSDSTNKNEESIILFLIDSSSSMEQIYATLDNNSNELLMDLVKNAELVKKSRMRQMQYLKKISKLHQGGDVPDKNTVSKKDLLLGLVSKVVKKIKLKGQSQQNENKRKIGFLFFNEHIFLTANGKNQNFPIIVDTNYQINQFNNDQYFDNQISYNRFKKTNFNKFEDLFNIGIENSNLYQQCINNFKIDEMKLNQVRSSGKTALGPALAVALGIVSKHSKGSTIVIVTDGKANYGILQSQNQYPQSYELVKMHLTDMKCSLGLLEWKESATNHKVEQDESVKKSISYKKSNGENPRHGPNEGSNYYLQHFMKKNKQITLKIEVALEMDTETIEANLQVLLSLAFKKIVAVAYQIKFISNKQFIDFEKTSFQQTLLNEINLISSDRCFWVTMKVNKQKIIEEDYQFPVCTQFILKYHDVRDQKTYCFVSQIQQNLQKSFKKLVQYVNFANLQEYFDNEDIKNYSEKNSIRSIQKTIREYMREESLSFKSKHRLQFHDNGKDLLRKSVKNNLKI